MECSFDAKGKVAIVTGGASGIGEATVWKFIEAGAGVGILDINDDAANKLVDEIKSKGGNAFYKHCDMLSEDSIKSSIDEIAAAFGRIDYAYNNAGIGGDFAKIQDYPTDNWDMVMAINLRAVFLCMKYEIPHILKQKGAIVNCASVLSTVAYMNDSAYVASKFGVLGLTKNAALEYGATGLRINSISPGFTLTPMIKNGGAEKLNKIAMKHAIERLANPEEMAQGVMWLCSDAASFAVGLNLLLDGGYTLQ
jgi:NAD(P)-dependent dehydrogenase (short-subunit alcohol dehydrogenase family)